MAYSNRFDCRLTVTFSRDIYSSMSDDYLLEHEAHLTVPGSVECWRCGAIYPPDSVPDKCVLDGCGGKRFVPLGERFDTKHAATMNPW